MQTRPDGYGLEWPDETEKQPRKLQHLAARPLVLVLDRDPLDASMLLALLTEASYQAVPVSDLSELVVRSERGDPHAVLVEVDCQGVTPQLVCDRLRETGYRGPLIFLTRKPDPGLRVTALRRGADDFVVKPYDPHELVARIQAVARRTFSSDHLASGDVIKVGDAELAVSDMRFTVEGRRPIYLTPTEMRLLECLMRNRSVTITREQLIERAWPHDYLADSNRIDVYVARLRKKIEDDPVHPEYIQTVRGSGYVFRQRQSSQPDGHLGGGALGAVVGPPQSA